MTADPGQGPKYRVRINDTRPIFYYCNAPTSCFKEKMIGAINPVCEPARRVTGVDADTLPRMRLGPWRGR